MTLLQRIEHWGDTHHPKWIDLIRIALGIFLCYKGVDFLRNMSDTKGLLADKMPFSSFMVVLMAHYIVFAHLMGGVLLALGTLTRFACLIQIPILLGAIIFINFNSTMWSPFSELALSLVVLGFLIYFLVVGNGPWSVDKLMEAEGRRK